MITPKTSVLKWYQILLLHTWNYDQARKKVVYCLKNFFFHHYFRLTRFQFVLFGGLFAKKIRKREVLFYLFWYCFYPWEEGATITMDLFIEGWALTSYWWANHLRHHLSFHARRSALFSLPRQSSVTMVDHKDACDFPAQDPQSSMRTDEHKDT